MTTSNDELLAAMKAASAQAVKEIERAARGVDLDDAAAVQRFANVWYRIIEEYGTSLREMAADRYLTVRRIHISRPYRPTYVNTSVDPKYALERLRQCFYTKPKDPNVRPVRLASMDAALPTIRQLTDEMVKQVPRNVLMENAHQDRRCRGYIRVLVGDSCAFCVMLASRAASLDEAGAPGLYKSQWSAGDRYSGNQYHGGCDCAVEPIFSFDRDMSRISAEYGGYDPEPLYQMYSDARKEAGTGNANAILAKMREKYNLT